MNEQFNADELAEIYASMALHEAKTVEGEVVGERVYMKSPFNPDLVDRLRQLKLGFWDGTNKRWVFPANRLDEVKALYKEFYGEDGFTEAVKATVEIDIDAARAAGIPINAKSKSLWFMGIQLVRTFGAGKKPRKDKSVKVLSGGFVTGGSANMPEVEVEPGTKIVVSDVPMDPLVQLLAGKGDSAGVTVVGSTAPNGMPAAAPTQNSTKTPSKAGAAAELGKHIASAVASGKTVSANGQISSGPAQLDGGITFNDLTDLDARTKYLQMELMIKAMATRAAQLPDDVVDDLLANVGLKRKK